MLSHVDFAFYVAGLRVAQAQCLCDTNGVLSDKATVVAALDRLAVAYSLLLDKVNGPDLLIQRIKASVQNVCNLIGTVSDRDDYGRTRTYDTCASYFPTLKDLTGELATIQIGQNADAVLWWELGFAIADGQGNTPWDVPPGHRPKLETPCWSYRKRVLVYNDVYWKVNVV
jgi:hypothetical protein